MTGRIGDVNARVHMNSRDVTFEIERSRYPDSPHSKALTTSLHAFPFAAPALPRTSPCFPDSSRQAQWVFSRSCAGSGTRMRVEWIGDATAGDRSGPSPRGQSRLPGAADLWI